MRHIFCIVGESGSGKSTLYNKILEDKTFCKDTKLKPLCYGTTRAPRNGEKHGVEYYFYTKDDFSKIPSEDFIENRYYHTINNGNVNYFTLKSHIQYGISDDNYIATASPAQYRSYLEWAKNESDISVELLRIEVPVIERLHRIMSRMGSSRDEDIYEMCRRITDEKEEFDINLGDLEKDLNHMIFLKNHHNDDLEQVIRSACGFISAITYK
jgi:guanylate kinase